MENIFTNHKKLVVDSREGWSDSVQVGRFLKDGVGGDLQLVGIKKLVGRAESGQRCRTRWLMDPKWATMIEVKNWKVFLPDSIYATSVKQGFSGGWEETVSLSKAHTHKRSKYSHAIVTMGLYIVQHHSLGGTPLVRSGRQGPNATRDLEEI